MPTPTPHNARKALSQPCGCHTIAVGCAAQPTALIASSAMNAPALMASTVCVTRSVGGSSRLPSSTTKSHSVSTISMPNTASRTHAHAPCQAHADRPRNSAQ
ncbi:hypothetical protein D9M69_648220 [compost metagenome]